ncbi:calcium-binding protein [Roseospira navarrensis]|uniref:Calcium-binding protein n=1 Tax=Roseospira navarrensis TaxID=140058 RepID=A0A7X2D326_9PROT|nr:calcium-binding protein [Roseospira navarrensis]
MIPFSAALLASTALTAHAAEIHNVGEVTALIAEASTADAPAEQSVDGQGGDTDFPFISAMKPLATVGEVDAGTGKALTGYPDGHAAWLADEDTVRVAYQSESYATMSNETYGWEMESGVTFTGSHVHTIDYARAGLADFLGNDAAASTIVEGTGHLFDTVYNVFGDEVVPRSEGGAWGNQALPDGTVVDFSDKYTLKNGDFFFQSFCGAFYEKANKYGDGIGFADDVWLNAEEWNIQQMFTSKDAENTVTTLVDTNDTMGLASIVVDIANETAYTVPALGQTGYEKLLPINPGHPDYVVVVLAGYNHDLEPAPLKIYIGRKGLDADGEPLAADAPARDQFLARNGLLYGKIYGMALNNDAYADLGIEEIDLQAKMMDAYLTNPDAPNTFDVTFFPTSYQWGGWDKPVAVKDTEMTLWQKPEEQPEGFTFFVGDSKTEHPAVDPDTSKQRYIQNMTNEGALLAIDFEGLGAALGELDGALPESVPASAKRIVAAFDGALTLEVGDKGIKHGGDGTAATWEDGTARTDAPDGLQWIGTADANVLIVDEDSGNEYGERKYALEIDPETLDVTPANTGYFLAMAGGKQNPRAANEVSAYGGTFSKATSSEFSGTWNVSALLARKDDGSFYSIEELSGTGEQEVNFSVPVNEAMLIGVVQHKGESGGAVAEVEADQGGQLFMFSPDLPM